MWQALMEVGLSTEVHVIPIDDIKEHSELPYCSCKPKVQIVEYGGMLIIHNSFDGREQWEHKQGS